MNKFHKLSTKHETYIKRFLEKYKNKTKIQFNEIDKNEIIIFSDNNEKIDTFNSKTTFKQFFMVCRSLGFIIEKNSYYEVINTKWDFHNVTNYIFTNSKDEKVCDYRTSRKICFLYLLNLLSNQNIKKWNIVDKKQKKPLEKMKNIEKEISKWENEAISSWKNITYVIERIKNEFKF